MPFHEGTPLAAGAPIEFRDNFEFQLRSSITGLLLSNGGKVSSRPVRNVRGERNYRPTNGASEDDSTF